MREIPEHGVTITASGQPGPYQDTRTIGTVKADTIEEARDKVRAALKRDILNTQDKGDRWSWPYFAYVRSIERGIWEFKFVSEFTD